MRKDIPSRRLVLCGVPRLCTPQGTRRLERRPAALCAYLAIEGPTPKHRLAGLLWSESGEAAARANMRQLLHRLRANGLDIVDGHEVLALRADIVSDVTSDGPVEAGELPHGAAVLLDGFDFDDAPALADWLAGARERQRQRQQRALDHEAARLEAAGQCAAALECAQAALQQEPLSEAAHRRVMRLHHLLGDRVAALAAWRLCCERLRAELGTEPSAESAELARSIERDAVNAKPIGRTAAVPLALLRPPVLAGRLAAWAAMEAAWHDGLLIVVSGPAGAGKTRLIEDFAASKGRVLRIEGRPGDAQVPYASVARNQRKVLAACPELSPRARNGPAPWVWQEAARVAPELGSAPPWSTPHDKLRFYDALMTLYSRGTQGFDALIVDDLHFYDDASLEMSTYAMGKAVPLGHDMPHHIAAFRDDEMPPRLRATMEALVSSGAALHIRLAPLNEAEVDELLRGLELPLPPTLAGELARYSGGNPLRLLETVRHLHQSGELNRAGARLSLSGPVKVHTEQRLSRLSAPALALARAAAVLSSDFTFEQVCRTVGEAPAAMVPAWQELEAAQIMQGERFSHDLLLDAVRASIPQAVEHWLHRAAAEVLERDHAHPSRVAMHWRAGGDLARAANAWRQAAQRARDLGLAGEANALLRQADEAARADQSAASAQTRG